MIIHSISGRSRWFLRGEGGLDVGYDRLFTHSARLLFTVAAAAQLRGWTIHRQTAIDDGTNATHNKINVPSCFATGQHQFEMVSGHRLWDSRVVQPGSDRSPRASTPTGPRSRDKTVLDRSGRTAQQRPDQKPASQERARLLPAPAARHPHMPSQSRNLPLHG
jgi:hypothetical protein